MPWNREVAYMKSFLTVHLSINIWILKNIFYHNMVSLSKYLNESQESALVYEKKKPFKMYDLTYNLFGWFHANKVFFIRILLDWNFIKKKIFTLKMEGLSMLMKYWILFFIMGQSHIKIFGTTFSMKRFDSLKQESIELGPHL